METSTIKFTEVDADHLIDLINNPKVRRLAPLSYFENLNKDERVASLDYKDRMWINEGYGPNILFI